MLIQKLKLKSGEGALIDAPKERPLKDIHNADGTLIVDKINRSVFPPGNLEQILARHTEASIL